MKLGVLLKRGKFKIKVVAEFWGGRRNFAVRHFSNGFEGLQKYCEITK
jgi:hypothetical protein